MQITQGRLSSEWTTFAGVCLTVSTQFKRVLEAYEGKKRHCADSWCGWDFVGETVNGTEDIWWILEGKDYPRLWWETKQIYD
jgi:hypothetical protein